jgi:hypothetical protein
MSFHSQIQKTVLQYPDVGCPGPYGHPISAEDACKFVALDGPSGGYPYPTTIDNAHDFKTTEKAREYRGHFSGFAIRVVTITYTIEDA